MKSLWLPLVLLAGNCGVSFAETMEVEYASFYSHLNKIDSEDTPALQFAFGFKQHLGEQLCELNQVQIETQKVTIPVTVSPQQRFLLPTEKALKQARAQVVIDLQGPANRCDMSVQLETKAEHLKNNYSYQELADLNRQYAQFFDDMGGFLSFMMPSVVGLTVQFTPSDAAQVGQQFNLQGNSLHLDKQWFATQQGLSLPVTPLRITALTEQ